MTQVSIKLKFMYVYDTLLPQICQREQNVTIKESMKIKKGVYQHFKGNKYEVIDIVRHSETLGELVLYKPLYKSKEFPNQLWVRPLEMFLEKVEKDGKKIPRFKIVKP